MKIQSINNKIIFTVLLVSCAVVAAGAASNAYYRVECETVGGVTRLAHLVKVQRGADVSVPGMWTIAGGADAVTFENGRIVVKGGLRFDAQGAAFTMTSRGVTFGVGSARYQIGLDGMLTEAVCHQLAVNPAVRRGAVKLIPQQRLAHIPGIIQR